jgi:hypothetical protein
MSLRKNVGSQFVIFRVWNDTNDQGITGDVANISMFIGLDGAAIAAATNAPTELSAANAPGWYQLELTQAEANANTVVVTGNSSTANAEVSSAAYHTLQWTYDGVSFEDFVTSVMAVLFGVASRTAAQTVFTKRDGTTTKMTVAHNTVGTRTASTMVTE